METCLTFDDVLIKPKFSTINSRKEVDLTTKLGPLELKLPILAANMDTVCGSDMAVAMAKAGGAGVLHRFWSIESNFNAAMKVSSEGFLPWVSVGINDTEWQRVVQVAACFGSPIVLDVAHGAQQQVAEFYVKIMDQYPDAFVIIGNFATADSINEFVKECDYLMYPHKKFKGAFKVGVGPGSACTTRIKTGIGVPQLSAIIDCVKTGFPIIADGGCKTSGDVAKALAAGAKVVMIGGMLAGTWEAPGEMICEGEYKNAKEFKKYRGSASKEAYSDQGKDWACTEGESFLIPYKGSVVQILQDIEGGLRSAFSYIGARTLEEFEEKSEFVQITNNGTKENIAHGKQ